MTKWRAETVTDRRWKRLAWSIVALLTLFAVLALTSRVKAVEVVNTAWCARKAHS